MKKVKNAEKIKEQKTFARVKAFKHNMLQTSH